MSRSQPVPKSLNSVIYQFYDVRRSMDYTWHEIADEFNALMGANYAESTLRLRYQTYDPEAEGDGEIVVPESLEIRADGTHLLEKVMFMDEDQAKTPEWVMEANGYAPNEWSIIKYKTGLWGSRDPESPFRNYAVSLELKQRDRREFTVQDLIEINKNYKYVHKKVKYTEKLSEDYTDHAISVALPDLHVGAPQSNIDIVKDRVQKIADFAREMKVDKIYLEFLGDVLHVDNTKATTVEGTPQELHMSASEMFLEAKNLVNFIIHTFSDFTTEVFWVAGNHSRALEFALFDGVIDTWSDNPQIIIDGEDKLRKAYRYGVQMVGMTHGDMLKKELFGWLADEFPEMWGDSVYREMHYGHKHFEELTPAAGVVNRQIGTVLDKSTWENMKGYRKSRKVVTVFVWCKHTGLKDIKYF